MYVLPSHSAAAKVALSSAASAQAVKQEAERYKPRTMVAVKLESAAGTTTQKRASRAANEDDTLLATTVTAFLLDAGIKDAKGAVRTRGC
jgi:hypothetical protein